MFDILLQITPFLLVYFFLHLGLRHRTSHPTLHEWITRIIFTLIICSYGLVVFYHLPVLSQLKNINDKNTLQSLALLVVSIAALLVFFSPIRRQISRSIPIDSDNPVHTVSLSFSFIVFVSYIITAFSLEQLVDTSPGTTIANLWTQDILLALIAFFGVGWLQQRNTKETLKRLGLVRPTWKIVLTGISFAICFVLINLVLEQLASITGFGIDPNVDKITTQQLGPLFGTIPGILTLGLAAALGEELLFRGAMLPRFGLLYTSILFTLVHANYGWSVATLIVFILAISLGVLRTRYSTTLTMVTHASYNIILGLLALLGSKLT